MPSSSLVPRDQLLMQRPKLLAWLSGGASAISRSERSSLARWAVEIEELPIEDRRHLVDAVAEQKGAVEHRDLGLLLGHIAAIYIDDAGHA